MKSFLQFLIFASIGCGILYFVFLNQEEAFQASCACDPNQVGCGQSLWNKLYNDFQSTNLFWLLAVCVCFMVSNLARAMRWNQLIEAMGYRPKRFNAFFTTMIGYLINLAIPRAGEVAKPATLAKYEKIPVERLLGTIVVDRAFDILLLLGFIGLTFLLQFQYLYNFLFGERKVKTCVNGLAEVENTSSIPWLGLFIAALVVGILTLGFIALKWQQLKETALFKKILQFALNFWEGIKSVAKLKNPGLFIFYTLLIWSMYYTMTYICFFAFGPTAHLGPLAGLLVFTFGSLGIVVPSPGGMGAYQVLVTAALVIYLVPEADAFAFSNIIFFTINILCNIIFGLISYILLPIYNKGYEPQVEEHTT